MQIDQVRGDRTAPAGGGAVSLDFAVSQSPVVFYVAEPGRDGPVTYISSNVEAVTGHAPASFQGASFAEHRIHPDDVDGYLRAVGSLEATGRASLAYRFEDSRGDYRWFRDELRLGRSPGGAAQVTGCMIDISDQVTSAAGRRDTEALIAATTEGALDAIVVMDGSGSILQLNAMAEQAFGYKREGAVGRSFVELFIPEHQRQRHFAAMQQAEAAGESPLPLGLFETVATRADGSTLPILLNIAEVELAASRVYVAVLWDISDRLDAHQERKRLSQLLHDAVESIPNGFGVYDSAERLILCNTAYATFLGETPQSMIGMSAAEAHHRCAVQLQAIDGDAIDDEGVVEARSLNRLRVADGTPAEMQLKNGKWLQLTVHPVADGGRVCIVSSITKLKHAEASLRESEEQFRAIVEGNPTPVRVSDLESLEILYESPAAAAIVGRSWPSTKKHLYTEDYADPADRERLAETVLRDGRSDNFETRMKRADGTTFWVSLSSRLIRYRGKDVCVTNFVDLSEAKARELELRHARETLEDAIASLSEGFALYDENDRLVLCNQRYRDFHGPCAGVLVPGVAWEEIKRAGAECGQYVDALGRVEDFMAERRQQRRELHSDSEFQQCDGRWFQFSNQRTRQGGIVVTWTDITRRKEMEKALRQSEALIRKVLQACPIPVRMWRPRDGQVLYESPSSKALLGETCSPGQPRRLSDIYVDLADRENYLARLDEASAVDDLEMQLKRPDGTSFWASVSARRIEHQGEVVVVSSVIDLTERRAVEEEMARQREALRESDERFRRLLDAYPVPVGMTCADSGEVIYENPASRALFSRSTGKIVWAEDFYVDPAVRAEYVRRLRRDGEVTDYEAQLKKADGTPFSASLTARLIEYQGREVIVSSVFDMTERRMVEEEIARQREALHQSEKLGALGSLLAGVAHELNNPLSVVVGQALLLKETAADRKIAERATKIGNAADRCSRIVKTFLAMARQQPSEQASVDINEIVEATLEVTGYSLRTTGIEVSLDLAPDLPTVWADADQLNQVVTNLVVNAQQAMAEHMGPRHLDIESTCDDGKGLVLLTVRDSGPGVPGEILSRIFEPFFTTKQVGAGTGIGLAVSHRIVESLGGKISVKSRPGEGAAFTISLPMAAPRDIVAPKTGAAKPKSRACRILVIDDEAEVTRMLRDILGADGHEVREAESGKHALDLLARHKFDVILSDLRMPNMDGPRLYESLKALSPSLLSRIAFITGDTFSPSVSGFLKQTERPYLQKPFSPGEVRELIRKVLAGRAGSPNP